MKLVILQAMLLRCSALKVSPEVALKDKAPEMALKNKVERVELLNLNQGDYLSDEFEGLPEPDGLAFRGCEGACSDGSTELFINRTALAFRQNSVIEGEVDGLLPVGNNEKGS